MASKRTVALRRDVHDYIYMVNAFIFVIDPCAKSTEFVMTGEWDSDVSLPRLITDQGVKVICRY